MTRDTPTIKESSSSVDAIIKAYEKCYGASPHWIVAAPGRVNVIGEHTDYNDGFVLPMAIERYTLIAAAPNASSFATIQSDDAEGSATIDLSRPIVGVMGRDWTHYPRGVLAGFQKRGIKLEGFNALVRSEVPIGAGLSSSAALLVATATLLELIAGKQLKPMDKVALCQDAEREFAGVPAGIMDHCISILGREGHLLLLDCRSRESQWVPIDDPSVCVLVVNTHVKHDLSNSDGYSLRTLQCKAAADATGAKSLREIGLKELVNAKDRMGQVAFFRGRHVISESERTVDAAEFLRKRDWRKAGELMYASHESLKTDYEVSCRELDIIVESAREIGVEGGVFGCRMTGAGFGGCAVALIQVDAQEEITRKIGSEYFSRTNIKPTLFVSRPASGAHVIRS
jgi:galactokinase